MAPASSEVEAASDELVEELQRTLHTERESRARVGVVASELNLRALLTQHKAAYSAFMVLFEKMAVQATDRFGYLAVRGYARTHLMASIDALGRADSRPARWRVHLELTSPVFFNRLVRRDHVGALERQWFADYIEQHFFFPAVEALWKQIGGAEQEPLFS